MYLRTEHTFCINPPSQVARLTPRRLSSRRLSSKSTDSRRRQRQGALPHTLLAAATESSEWGRLGEANAPLLLALRRAAMKGDAPAAEAAVAALEGNGARVDLIALTHLMQAYAVRRDVDGARVRSFCW